MDIRCRSEYFSWLAIFAHLLPTFGRKITDTFLSQDPTTHAITDMFSFYSLPSSILNNPKHSVLNAAYLFYYATDTAFDDSPSFQRGSSSGRSGSASSSASTSGAAASASAEGLEEWQTSGITGLNEQELRDEEGVVTWDEESDEVKSRIKQRLNKLMEDLLILARDVSTVMLESFLTTLDRPLTEMRILPLDRRTTSTSSTV